MREDGITKISPDGEVLYSKSIFDIIFDNDLGAYLYAVNQSNLDKDPFHLNDIEPVLSDSQFWKVGDIFLSLRNRSLLLLYRPNTHEVIWYKSGITSQQHDIDVISDHEISIFDNNMGDETGFNVDGSNLIAVYDFNDDQVSFPFREDLMSTKVKTRYAGSANWFSDGNLMVEESNYGRVVGYSRDSNEHWAFYNRSSTNSDLSQLTGSRIVPREVAEAFLSSRNSAICD